VARVTALTDTAVQMELVVWIDDPEKGEAELRSELLRGVLRTFRAEGIRLASPRRDVTLITTAETAESVDKTIP